MRTIREWFEELPEEEKALAIENTDEVLLSEQAKDMSEAIRRGFYWEESPQGHHFWSRIDDRYVGR